MTILKSDDRDFLTAEEDDSVGNSIQWSFYEDKFYIQIDNPWSGDTETGIGRTANITMSPNDAKELAAFILARVAA